MSASIQVSDLKYDTNNGTILSVGLIVNSQSFRVEFTDHKYIVTNNGKSLVKIIAPDMNQTKADVTPKAEAKTDMVEPNADTKATPKAEAKTDMVEPNADTKATPKAGRKAKPKIVNDAKSFGNNDQLITILRAKGFN